MQDLILRHNRVECHIAVVEMLWVWHTNDLHLFDIREYAQVVLERGTIIQYFTRSTIGMYSSLACYLLICM